MQAVTIAEDLDVGKLLFGRVLEPLRQPRRESERAPVLEIDDDAFGRAIVAGGGGAGLVLVGDASLLEGGVDGRTVASAEAVALAMARVKIGLRFRSYDCIYN